MSKLAVVFGGSGFVGTQVVRALCRQGWRVRVAVRRPHQANELRVEGKVGQVQLLQTNIRSPLSIHAAMQDADVAINLVGVLFESGRQKFQAVHVAGAGALAKAATNAGVSGFVHVSAIGADANASSSYARSKAEGERAVKEAFPDAVLLRPSVIFGSNDGLFERFAALARFTPVLPVPGANTKMQPVYVGDVAAAILAAASGKASSDTPYELGGPKSFTLGQIVAMTMQQIDRKRFVFAVPGFLANVMGFMGELFGAVPLFDPFLTRDQVRLLEKDNVASSELPGLKELGIEHPETVEAHLPKYLGRFRRYGEFHEVRPAR